MDINNARNNLLQRRSKLLSEGLNKSNNTSSNNEEKVVPNSSIKEENNKNIKETSNNISNQEDKILLQKPFKNRRIGDFDIDDNSDINEMLNMINSNYEEEWENTEEEYNFYNKNLDNINIKKDNNELYNDYDNIGSIEEYTKDDNFMLDENEYLSNNKYKDEDDDTDDDTDNTSDDNDDDDPEFRNKYKEIFELNKQKLSKKAKDAVEEDEKEMTSIIKTFKEKKIKSSRKSLDLKKLRGTFREEELEMKK